MQKFFHSAFCILTSAFPKMPFKSQSLDDFKIPKAKNSSRQKRDARLEKMPQARVVLGVDPGLHRTGFGVLGMETVPRFLGAGVLKAKADAPLPVRLESLFDGLCEVIKTHHPDVVVVEDLFSTYAHPRSALLMAQARGVLLLAAQQSQIPVHSFLPNEVKQVVSGDGHASKEAIQNAVKARLYLKEIPQPHDAADALAIALCFALRQNVNRR
jgi:crossover junction endodeoxyribonuclease RuvC